jgi:hypothetical protein
VKIAALLANGAKISDAEGTAIASQGRVQIRWRLNTNGSPWINARTDLSTYNASKDFFQADVKASSLALQAGKSYVVQVRILPVVGAAQPTQSLVAGTFDLGTAQFILNVNRK